MAKRTDERLRRLRREFQEEAGEAFDQIFASDEQNGLATFTQREDRARQAGDGLTLWLLREHLTTDEAADPGEDVCCPLCAAAVHCPNPDRAELESRKIKTGRGEIELGVTRPPLCCIPVL